MIDMSRKGYHILGISALMSLILLSSTSLVFANAASYNNVQVYIQTTSNLPDRFTVSAYNMTGYLVASTQTQYPAAAFELPDGQYIFTATAEYQYYYTVPMMGGSTGVTGSGIAKGEPTPAPYYVGPLVEYGYSVRQVAGSMSFTISTQNVTSFPTTKLTVKVTFANGTATPGASVSTSVIGSWYYWGYGSDLVTWNSTDADGVATLIAPQAPIRIDVWSWVPIPLPPQTGSVVVGGEKANVTVYNQAAYAGLAGSTVIIPPQTSATVTLHDQQSSYWIMPYAARETAAREGLSTVPIGPDSIPARVYSLQLGNPNLANYLAPQNAASNPLPVNTLLLALTVSALATAAASLLIAVRAHRRRWTLGQ